MRRTVPPRQQLARGASCQAVAPQQPANLRAAHLGRLGCTAATSGCTAARSGCTLRSPSTGQPGLVSKRFDMMLPGPGSGQRGSGMCAWLGAWQALEKALKHAVHSGLRVQQRGRLHAGSSLSRRTRAGGAVRWRGGRVRCARGARARSATPRDAPRLVQHTACSPVTLQQSHAALCLTRSTPGSASPAAHC